jgi:Zn finger protein HypA/HybF involved in hydrogenase expression
LGYSNNLNLANKQAMKFVTIKESHYQTDLVVLKTRLESEGIECRFKNELTAQVLNHIPSFLVELQVPEKDVPRVKEIMIENGDLMKENTKVVCPKCGSEKVKIKLSFAKRIGLVLSIFPLLLFRELPVDKLFRKSNFVCKDCKNVFAL